MKVDSVINVQATGSLREYVPPGTTVTGATTVGEVVNQLALPEAGELLLLVNGQMAYWHTTVSAGDTVKLVPAMSGG